MKNNHKILVFDFDGTLTLRDENIWLKVWQRLNYSTAPDSYCAQLLQAFKQKQISFSKWCTLTTNAFRERNLSMEMLVEVARETQFLKNIDISLKNFHDNGFLIFISTDNIKQVVYNALGDNMKYIQEVFAHEVTFDRKGIIEAILKNNLEIGNKAKTIETIIEKYNSTPEDIIFIGNSYNDEGVKSTGCTTICVNPKKTDANNKEHWSHNLGNFDDMLTINSFIEELDSNYSQSDTQI